MNFFNHHRIWQIKSQNPNGFSKSNPKDPFTGENRKSSKTIITNLLRDQKLLPKWVLKSEWKFNQIRVRNWKWQVLGIGVVHTLEHSWGSGWIWNLGLWECSLSSSDLLGCYCCCWCSSWLLLCNNHTLSLSVFVLCI